MMFFLCKNKTDKIAAHRDSCFIKLKEDFYKMYLHVNFLSKASMVAQLVKNPPAMQETWVWEDPLEKGKAPHSSILAWRISWTV